MGSNSTDVMSSIDERLDEKLIWAIASALLVVHVIVAWRSREIGLVSAQDDGRYILLARSLRDFSYRDLYLVGLPYHSSYPPLYPAALAVWALIFGESYSGFVLMNIGLSAVALAVSFAALKRGWSASGGLLCLALLVVNPFLIFRAGGVWSEMLFIALSYMALWALATRQPSTRMMWLAGAAAIAATLTRSVGLALVVAIGLVWLAQRRYQPLAVFTAAACVTVGAWTAWSAFAPGQVVGYHYFADALSESAGTQGHLGSLAARVLETLPNYAGLTTPWVLAVPTIPGTPVDNVLISVGVLAAVLVGMFSLSRRWPVATVYMVLYGAVLVVWPYHRPRFLEPLLPLLFATSLLGIGLIARWFRPAWALPAVGVAAALLAFGAIPRTLDFVRLRSSCGAFSVADPPECMQADRASLLRTIDYIGRRTPDGSIFVAAKPEALYIYTSRRSVLLQATLAGDPEQYLKDLERQGVDYVILGSLHTDEPEHLEPRLRRHCSELAVEAFFAPRTYLFRLGGEGAAGELDACEALEDYRKASENRRFVQDRT